jgi:hypothetical protein
LVPEVQAIQLINQLFVFFAHFDEVFQQKLLFTLQLQFCFCFPFLQKCQLRLLLLELKLQTVHVQLHPLAIVTKLVELIEIVLIL